MAGPSAAQHIANALTVKRPGFVAKPDALAPMKRALLTAKKPKLK